MLRTTDVLLIAIMSAAATVTYSIKHNTENKLEAVHELDAKIKLEQETIDLLKADWALLSQPNRLARLAQTFKSELNLEPTEPDQIVQPEELPKLRVELPQPEGGNFARVDDGSSSVMVDGIPVPVFANRATDQLITGAIE